MTIQRLHTEQRAACRQRRAGLCALAVQVLLAGVGASPAHGADDAPRSLACGNPRGEVVRIRGKVEEPHHLSGAAASGPYLLVVSDEVKHPTRVEVLKRDGGTYQVVGDVELPAGDDEVDLEAVAVDGTMVYVSGSHAATRKIEHGRIEAPKRKPSREQFFRFRLATHGTAGTVEGPQSLLPAIQAEPVLRDFIGTASKENGIDIEGLAVKDGRLYFGFRGPVLRGGLVPVLSTTWDDPVGAARVHYVRLDGRGVRDLAAVAGGLLILAGPVGDGDMSYRVYFWDGVDQLTDDEEGPRPQVLAEFASGPGKPEGLAVLDGRGHTYDVLLLCDGLPKGGLTRLRLTRP
jgi:hypothetical protein